MKKTLRTMVALAIFSLFFCFAAVQAGTLLPVKSSNPASTDATTWSNPTTASDQAASPPATSTPAAPVTPTPPPATAVSPPPVTKTQPTNTTKTTTTPKPATKTPTPTPKPTPTPTPAPTPAPAPTPTPAPAPTPPPPVSNRCIVTVNGSQYDVTNLRRTHSGGDIFTCGTDMTSTFMSMHGTNWGLIARYKV